MEATNKQRENLKWPAEDKTRKQLEAIRELAKELGTDYPTDTPDEPKNYANEVRNRRNAYIRAQFVADENGCALHLLTGSEWLELFDMLGFTVDKETRKRFASHLKWYSFWYADFKPRLSSKYAQRIHWYVTNFLFCLCNKLQTEKDYREGKYGSKGQAYFMEMEQQPATPTETPQISTETAETVNVSAEPQNEPREAGNKPIKERMKSYARITGQHNRLWLAASGNKARQDRITAIWHRYTANISRHFKNPFMSEWDAHGTDELPRSIYAATNAPQSPETPQAVNCTTDTATLA